jgi:uncharacterized protein YdbL (DUF1318 family)
LILKSINTGRLNTGMEYKQIAQIKECSTHPVVQLRPDKVFRRPSVALGI